jgi:hypothetical protein
VARSFISCDTTGPCRLYGVGDSAGVLDALNHHVEATGLRARHAIAPETPQLVFLRGLGVARSRLAHHRHVISIFNV